MPHVRVTQSSRGQSRCPWEGGGRLLGGSSAAGQHWDRALPAAGSGFSLAGEGGPGGLCWGARHPESHRSLVWISCVGARGARCSARAAACPCLLLETVDLSAAVLRELYVPDRLGGLLLPSHFTSVGFPTPCPFLSIWLRLSVETARWEAEEINCLFLETAKSSTQGK